MTTFEPTSPLRPDGTVFPPVTPDPPPPPGYVDPLPEAGPDQRGTDPDADPVAEPDAGDHDA